MLILQHAVGEPEFQRRALALVSACIAENRLPAWHEAYLEDRYRISRRSATALRHAMDARSNGRPWSLADADHVNELRGQVGLGPMRSIPEMGPELPPEQREEIERNNRWWQHWFIA